MPQETMLPDGLPGSSRKGWRPIHGFVTFAVIAIMAVGGYTLFERVNRIGWTHTKGAVPVVSGLPPPSPLREIVGSFAKNQTITDALIRGGIPAPQVAAIVAAAKPVYNLARVVAGKPYWLFLTAEGQFHDFRYAVDDERYLTIYREEDRFGAVMKNFAYETRRENVSGTIDNSLFAAVSDLGEGEILAEELAGIFAGDIDFYTEVQPGDSFRVLVDKKYLDGGFKKYGPIFAASITNQNKTITGYRFQDEKGRAAYYDADGKALRKSFLKSPLKFSRISSRFSFARRHPILKVVLPHTGVDYAAPVGTPVQAVGSGTVLIAGQSAASGKMVRLRHAGGYETMYLHLSAITVRAGSRVEQSQLIGYVGATGLATGPHLDFRVFFHGRPINPSKVIFPPNPPVPADRFSEFAAVRDKLKPQLERNTD